MNLADIWNSIQNGHNDVYTVTAGLAANKGYDNILRSATEIIDENFGLWSDGSGNNRIIIPVTSKISELQCRIAFEEWERR